MAKLKKPASIAKDEFKSQKFDELTQGRSFTASDIPTLAMLCHWHQIAQQCINDQAQNQDKKKTKKASLLTLVVKDRAKKSGGA